MPRSKKYGVTNLGFGFNTEPLYVTVESISGQPWCRFILRDKDGKGRIIAFPQPRNLQPALLKTLLVNHSYKILPSGCKAVKKWPDRSREFKSQVRNSKFLHLVNPAKIIALEHQGAHNGHINESIPNINGSRLQSFISDMNTTRGGSIYKTVEDVEILEGNVRRYIGCQNCRKRVKGTQNGEFICQNDSKKKCAKFRTKVNPTIYYVIANISIKADDVNFCEPVTCHDANAQVILGREAFDFDNDSEAQKLFDQQIKNTLFKLELRGDWTTKFGRRWKFTIKTISVFKVRPQDNSSVIVQGINDNEFESESETEAEDHDSLSFGVRNENGNTSNTSAAVSDLANAFEVMVIRNEPDSLSQHDLQIRSKNDIAYNINSDPRGLVLIINNTNFPNFEARRGSEKDLANLQELFVQLSYRIIVREDVASTDLESIIYDFQEELRNSNCDSCFVVVMTHGSCNSVHMSDEKPVNIYTDIIYKFNTAILPEFEGKPKIFIFQSCQNFEPMESSKHKQLQYPDTLICLPNLPGFYSHRHTKKGSWFIQKLVEVFMKEAHRMEIQKMLNLVEQSFHENSTKKRRQQPIHIPILFSKDFYFNLS